MTYRGYNGPLNIDNASEDVLSAIKSRNDLYNHLLKIDFNLGIGKTGDAPIDILFEKIDDILRNE